MKKLKLGLLWALAIGFSACEKYNQIDNNATVTVPYVLFVGGEDGYLASTNDGFIYNDVYTASGSKPTRAIHIVDSNIINIRENLYTAPPKRALQNKNLSVLQNDQNMSLYDAVNNRVYVCGRLTSGGAERIIYSEDKGITWLADNNYNIGNTGVPTPNDINSITQTTNGKLWITNQLHQIFVRTAKGTWDKVTPTTTIDSIPAPIPGLPGQDWFISSHDTTLVLVDKTGNYGAYYSKDGGVKWKFLTGLPAVPLLFAKQTDFGGQYFIGTKGAGLWRLNGTNMERTDGGMLPNTDIYSVVAKRIVYRTDIAKYFYFAATSTGLYRSENGAYDWVRLSSHPLTELW